MERLAADGATTPGFLGLLRGSRELGAALITDRGFVMGLAKKYTKLGIKTPREFCQDNDIPFFWPFNEDDDVGLMYDAIHHVITMEPKEDCKVGVMTS